MSKIKRATASWGVALIAACAATAIPATAGAAPRHQAESGERATQANADKRANDELAGYEREYLKVRREFVANNGVRAAGRNIVRDGYLENDGDAREATRAEVRDSILTLDPPPAPEPVVTSASEAPVAEATETTTSTGGAAATSATAQCESGGDYGAVNPAGYYGAYQFDQSTWDAYAPSGYEGVNPAEAPPAIQDAAAASVPYDAWPNC